MNLAVAVIIGGAFEKIVTSLVNDIIMPIIAMLGNMEDIASLKAGPFTYGQFLAAVINFILIALVLFMIIKAMNRAKSIKA